MNVSYLYVARGLRCKLPKALPATLELANKIKAARVKQKRSVKSWRARNAPKLMLNSAKGRARTAGLTFDLTEDWIKERYEVCELSGLKMVRCIGSPGPLSPSIDRIDSRFGYTKTNCRVICMALNGAFNSWGEAAFEPIAKAWIQRISKKI